MNNDDPVFEQAVQFLANTGELPTQIKSTKDKFLAACLRSLYQGQQKTHKQTKKNDRRILRLEVLLGFGGSSGLFIWILRTLDVI